MFRHEAIIKAVPEEHRETMILFSIDIDNSIKALRIYWNITRDEFGFKVDIKPASTATKRSTLSDVTQLFEPHGWLSPCKTWFWHILRNLNNMT